MTNRMTFHDVGHPDAPPFEWTGDFYHPLNKARFDYHWARYIGMATFNRRGQQSLGMRELNATRNNLRRLLGLSPNRITPDFDWTIAGIPCGVKMSKEGDEITLYDRRGYRAHWLEDKATRKEYDEIQEYAEQLRYENWLSIELSRRGLE